VSRRATGSSLASLVLALCCAVGVPAPLRADPPADAVLIDGLSLMAGGRPADESGATPVLISDVGLEADLLLVRRFGTDWERAPRSAQLLLEARRVAAIVTLLAGQARQMGEEVGLAQIEAARKLITERAGGPAALAALLERHGAGPERLDRWLTDSLLATAQVRYITERIEPPTDEDVAELEPTGGPGLDDQELRAARDQLRDQIHDRKVARAVADWLESSLERSLLRLLR
jgi:hypothetical protein